MDISKKIYWIDIVIVFLYVFCISLPLVRNTVYLMIPFLLLFVLLNKKTYCELKTIVFSKYYTQQALILISIIFYSFFISIFHTTNDFTIIPTFINLGIMSFTAVLIVLLLQYRNYTIQNILQLLIKVFVLQSAIQIIAFFNGPFRDIIRLTYTEGAILKAEGYSNMRGLALTDSVFFSLSVIYGAIFIFYFQYLINKGKYTSADMFRFILLFIGAFFSGRTFFIGLFIGGIYFFFSKGISLKKKTVFCFKICLLLLIVILIIYLLLPDNYKDFISDVLLRYVFEFIYSYLDTGAVATTSSEHLLDDMYYELPLSTIIAGDGCYTASNGAYYGDTDSGYMRNFLFFGIGGFLLLFSYQLSILFGYRVKYNKEDALFPFILLLFILTTHIKGEVLGFLQSLHRILFLYFYFVIFSKNNLLKHEHNKSY